MPQNPILIIKAPVLATEPEALGEQRDQEAPTGARLKPGWGTCQTKYPNRFL